MPLVHTANYERRITNAVNNNVLCTRDNYVRELYVEGITGRVLRIVTGLKGWLKLKDPKEDRAVQ